MTKFSFNADNWTGDIVELIQEGDLIEFQGEPYTVIIKDEVDDFLKDYIKATLEVVGNSGKVAGGVQDINGYLDVFSSFADLNRGDLNPYIAVGKVLANTQ